MTHASLFSGIGGFDLAAHWAGIENVFACEIDDFCRRVLAKRFPETTLYKDIKETKFEQYCGTVDIISGGFPCQPFSVAGKRAGTEDNRYLWGEMLRVVREVKPTWVIAENVRGLTNITGGSTFETVCNDLEVSGYEVQPFIIPALSVGAPHRRERVWIVAHATTDRRIASKHECGNISEQISKAPEREFSGAIRLFDGNPAHSNSRGLERTEKERGQSEYVMRGDFGVTRSITHPDSERLDRSIGKESTDCALHRGRQDWSEKWIEALTRIYGMDDGLPGGMDGLEQRYKDRSRKFRIKAMGNAIVPQIAYQIFTAIKGAEGL